MAHMGFHAAYEESTLSHLLGGGDFHTAGVVGGDFVEHRRDHLARAAPRRPEVHDDGHVGVQNFALEVRFVDFGGWFHNSISFGINVVQVCSSNGCSAKASARTGFSPVASLTRTRPASQTLARLAAT